LAKLGEIDLHSTPVYTRISLKRWQEYQGL
jgi:hypothetical protein